MERQAREGWGLRVDKFFWDHSCFSDKFPGAFIFLPPKMHCKWTVRVNTPGHSVPSQTQVCPVVLYFPLECPCGDVFAQCWDFLQCLRLFRKVLGFYYRLQLEAWRENKSLLACIRKARTKRKVWKASTDIHLCLMVLASVHSQTRASIHMLVCKDIWIYIYNIYI